MLFSSAKPNELLHEGAYKKDTLVAVKDIKTGSWLRALIERPNVSRKAEVNFTEIVAIFN